MSAREAIKAFLAEEEGNGAGGDAGYDRIKRALELIADLLDPAPASSPATAPAEPAAAPVGGV